MLCGSVVFKSEGAVNGTLVGAEYGDVWEGKPLLETTGNNGWDTGGATGNAGCIPGGAAGGRIVWTGNRGCGTIPKGAVGGTEPTGCCVNHGCGRGGAGQPARGTANPGLYLL